jgi:hypothetical protein
MFVTPRQRILHGTQTGSETPRWMFDYVVLAELDECLCFRIDSLIA